MERNSDNTRFNKNSSNYKKYVKIAKNQIQILQIKNKEVYTILLESQVKENPIAYTKWEKCLKKEKMHTLTCITQTLFFTFNYLELNKLKIFKWKLIHFIIPCKELLKQWRIVNNSDCLVCKEKKKKSIFTLIVNITKNIGKR